MYRKILGLSLGLISGFRNLLKALLILKLSLISSFFSIQCQPFVLKKTNFLEYLSNISLVVIISSSLFYMLEVNEYIKLVFFFIMAGTNFRFLWYSFFGLLKIFYQSHVKAIFKKVPFISKILERIHRIKHKSGLKSAKGKKESAGLEEEKKNLSRINFKIAQSPLKNKKI